ncbi:MAG: hypothetical protein WCG92_26965, partial [Hyphomicrobiales bacterium]
MKDVAMAVGGVAVAAAVIKSAEGASVPPHVAPPTAGGPEVIATEDRNHDGVIDAAYVDTNGDGMADAEILDVNEDGVMDVVVADLDHDGQADHMYADTNEDGAVDLAAADGDA